MLALARGEIGADLQDGVALGQHAKCGELAQHYPRHPPAARAELEDLPTADRQHRGALARHTAAEEIRHLRGGDKVPAGTEFGAAGAVVAQPGRIQRQLHEALERQPSAACDKLPADQRGEGLAVRVFLGTERGQD